MAGDRPIDLDELLARVPTTPGVYLMKDRRGKVIYVGKAIDLRARVRQYFRPGGDGRFFVAAGLLGRALADIETVVVENEKEALLLENHLIKQHQPRFNINLRDDKQYLVLRIDPSGTFPRVEVVRNIRDDGARYFGPYHSATSCRETLRTVNRHFQLRTCTDHVLATRQRPCLQYFIKRCPAPCVLPIEPAAYAESVKDVILFLSGRDQELVPRLRARMGDAAAREQFESAAQIRDSLAAIEKTLSHQHVVQKDFVDQDVFGMWRAGEDVEVVVLFVRQGKLMGRRAFRIADQELSDEQVMTEFVQRYYDLGTFVPDEVVVPGELEGTDVIAEWLSGRRGKKVRVLTPARGTRSKLLSLAAKNAAASAVSRASRSADALAALGKLQQRLGLSKLPRRIECYDIAHIQGTSTVASMVVFIDGEPARGEYRRFKVKSVGNDDFASMYEVLSRRLRRAAAGDERWPRPDLMVIDGGKGQLGTVLAAIADAGMTPLLEQEMDVIALAKERGTDPETAPDAPEAAEQGKSGPQQPDRVFRRNIKDPIRLRPNTAELFLLARIRDEAHRFANTFHRELRKRSTLRSALDDIDGIGPKRRRALLRHFGSLKAVRAATLDELAAAPGMTRKSAEAVFAWSHAVTIPPTTN